MISASAVPRFRRAWTRCSLPFLAILAAASAHAQVVPQVDLLAGKVLAPAGFVATPVPQELSRIQGELDAGLLGDVVAFRSAAGTDWKFYIDRRSGAAALVEGVGLPWLPGAGNSLDPASVHGSGANGAFTVADLETKARALVDAYPDLFRVPSSELVLDPKGSSHFGERGQFWNLAFRQVAGGLPVEGSLVVFRVSHGNLVQFGVNRVLPSGLGVPAPGLSAAAARNAVAGYLGGLLIGDALSAGSLRLVLRGTADEVGYTGPVGAGWQPRPVYLFNLTRTGSAGAWRILVDAVTGAVVRFVDGNDYATALAKGSVLVDHNCADPSNCVPGTAPEVPVALPHLKLQFVGGSCSGDGCYSNSAGAFQYPAGALSAATILGGKYFQVIDACGPVAGLSVAPGDLDLGATGLPSPLSTDCSPATRQSAPGTGVLFAGTGDTPSARTLYYHLNLINEKSRFYLPANTWLQAAAGPALVTSNLPPACNAFWQGTTNSLNFMRQTPVLGCNNTGEVPPVFLHEFGHGLDQNDGTGTAPESATGEATGDTYALLQGQKACFGAGFRLATLTDPDWGASAGYGDATTGSKSRLCTGIRELDYTRLCSRGEGLDCSAPHDPDAPNGSRSGSNPPAEPAGEAGTPARWNTMADTSTAGVADGLSNFYDCGGPETGGCAGPLNHGCHCESAIASQANWDLAKRLIGSEFGGDVYADPQGPNEVAGWQYMDRLWYLTRDLTVSGYSATGPVSEGSVGMTNGCAVTDWYSSYRFVDDDNGDLSDGTPHADSLFAAFDLHGIACGEAEEPANQPTGCPAPIAAPVVATCGAEAPVQLTWSASAGANRYRVLRNTLGCGFGFTPVGVVGGSRSYFEDREVAPGVTYYYSVQPVGANDSCYGLASNCVAVTPSACSGAGPGSGSIAAPTGVTLSTPAANQVQVSWNAVAGASSYKILRKEGSCSSTAPEQAVGVISSPLTSFVDGDGLQGQSVYSYRVAASGATCAACASAYSACQSVTAHGSCHQPVTFAGVQTVASATGGSCQLTVGWQPAASACGGAFTYDVYRSTDPFFTPSGATLVAADVAGTSWADTSVTGGARYFYVVRATDVDGNTESNVVRRWESAGGVPASKPFLDTAGDSGGVQLYPSATAGNLWSVRGSDTNNATRQYATTPAGNYTDSACQGLESRTLTLSANSTLSFRSRTDTEVGWDGGYVEVATEAGGFANWTKLGTINYPGLMLSPDGDPACGGPGFADGQPVFTGTSLLNQWKTFSGSLSAYAGQRIRLRFLFSSDTGTNQGGWFVDDVQVSNVQLQGSCTP